MRTKLIAGTMALCALLGCRDKEVLVSSETVVLPGLTIRTDKNTPVLGAAEVSMFTTPQNELICKVIAQSGRVVSLLPTPIGSDDIHAYAGFRPLGNGWHPISFFNLNDGGKITIEDRQGVALDQGHFQDMVDHQDQVYVFVEQNAPYSNLLTIATQLAARTTGTFGIGWRARYPDMEDVSSDEG